MADHSNVSSKDDVDDNAWPSLAEVAQREIAASPRRAASDPFSPSADAAILALTEAIIADGVMREIAEHAVTRWMITKEPIVECVRLETESPALWRPRCVAVDQPGASS